MKRVFFLLSVFCVLGFVNVSHAKLKLDQRQYTCSELKQILNDHGSIWVKNKLFPFIYQNIALSNPVCNGSARSHPRRICRWYEGRVTAKDGRCRLGRECSCREPENNDDDD